MSGAVVSYSCTHESIQKRGEFYSSEVEIVVDSDRDYELFMTIGYKTSLEDDMEIIDIHTTEKGTHKVTFQSRAKPVLIQIDPACRVPQINLDNNIWGQ